MRPNKKRWLILAIVVLIVIFASSCSSLDDHDEAVPPDFHGCLFNDSAKRGYDFKEDKTAEDGSFNVDDETRLVLIPISNRFLNISNTANRDPGEPRFLEGRSSNIEGSQQGVGIWGEVQLHFKFVPSEACTWYQDHGSRNAEQGGPYRTEQHQPPPPGVSDNRSNGDTRECAGDLEPGDMGFNVRGCMTPWFTYLAENFGLTAQNVWPTLTSQYTWQQLTQNPVLDSGPHEGDLVWDALAADFGEAVTTRLNRALTGGDERHYFCGVSVDIDSINEGDCPPMEVDIIDIHTNNPELEDQAEQLVEAEQTRDTANQLSVVLADIQQQRDALEANAELERLQAQQDYLNSDPIGIQCAALASIGVDCADVIRANNGVPTVTGNDHVVVNGGQVDNGN